jgi:hypothetical protein
MPSIDEILAGEQPAFARAVNAVIIGNAAALVPSSQSWSVHNEED